MKTVKLLVYQQDLSNFLRELTALPILLLPAMTGKPDSLWLTSPYFLIIWFLLSDMNFLLHQHVHLPLTHSSRINRVLDFVLSIVTGMTAYNWRQQHVFRHHWGDDSWGAAYDWEFRNPSIAGYLSYALRGIPVVYFYPLVEAFYKGVLQNVKHPVSFRHAFIEQIVVLCIVWTLIFHEPLFYGPYYFLVMFFTRGTDYDNHTGCDQSSEYGFSNVTVNPIYNAVRNNFGYHTAHHYFPTVHWTELPTKHAEISSNIPADRIGKQRWTGTCTPPLLNMGLKYFLQKMKAK